MAYRVLTASCQAGDDSNLQQSEFDRTVVLTQSKDLNVFVGSRRVAPADSDTSISILPVTTGYYVWISSDYPVLVRLNGSGATQHTLKTNGVAVTNNGAPVPDQCLLVMSGTVTSIYLAPIASAAQTATVKIMVTGDPTSAY